MNDWDLLLSSVLQALAAEPVLGFAAIPAGVLLVFVLPGYALTEALRPELARHPWAAGTAGATRIAFTLGLSVALTVLLGLVLNVTFGLTRTTWTIGLGAITISACLVALYRRGWDMPALGSPHVSVGSLALFLVACCMAVAAMTADVTAANRIARPGFTQLWILPAGTNTVQLGVASHETVAARYSLVLDERAGMAQRWSFVLRPGAEWRVWATVATSRGGPRVALLRCSLHPHTTYRKVYLWSTPS
jgi:hypothetical protein